MFEKIAFINWLAVLTAGFTMFMIGGVWYGAIFAKLWQRLNAYSDEQLKQMQSQRSPQVFFPIMFAAYVVGAAVMALLVVNLDLNTPGSGAALGALLWLFGAFAIGLTDQITRLRPFAAHILDSAYQLIAFSAGGALLALWR